MYGFPSNFDASKFLDCVLEYVLFTANTVHFEFEDDVSITVTSCLSHVLEKDSEIKKIEIPILESQLMQLVGEKIVFSEAKTDGTLILPKIIGQPNAHKPKSTVGHACKLLK